jgi:hypothetical protein
MEESGIVYVPELSERLGRLLERARSRAVTLPAQPSLELARDLLAQSTSIASPNE